MSYECTTIGLAGNRLETSVEATFLCFFVCRAILIMKSTLEFSAVIGRTFCTEFESKDFDSKDFNSKDCCSKGFCSKDFCSKDFAARTF